MSMSCSCEIHNGVVSVMCTDHYRASERLITAAVVKDAASRPCGELDPPKEEDK